MPTLRIAAEEAAVGVGPGVVCAALLVPSQRRGVLPSAGVAIAWPSVRSTPS